MGANSAISWTTHTFNPWIGCQKVSKGCDNCYAEEMLDTRWGRVKWGPGQQRIRTKPGNWKNPRYWARDAKECGDRPRVFCASLADVLDNQAPQEWRNDLWELVHATPELDWLFLTKRPQNFPKMAPPDWLVKGCPGNVWWGTTTEDQDAYDQRIEHLRAIKARVRFLSCEPLVGPLRLRADDAVDLHWVIVGGESGAQARLMLPEWARVLRNECDDLGVAFFFKQTGRHTWGGPRSRNGKGDDPKHWPPDLRRQAFPAPREWPLAA